MAQNSLICDDVLWSSYNMLEV